MSKHSRRHYKARRQAIQAAGPDHPITWESQPLEWIQAAEDDTPEKPKRFKMRAYSGGPMQVGYYSAPVVIDMAGLTAAAPLPILLDHDTTRIVGHADEVSKGESSLDLTGVISGASPEAEQVVASAKLGFPWKASIGARPDKLEFVGEGIKTTVNGRSFTGPLYVARKATLGEVSFVAIAADAKTSAKVAASAAQTSSNTGTMTMDFDQWVLALFGGAKPELTDQQNAGLRARFDTETKPKPPTGDPPTTEPIKAAAPTFDLAGIVLTYEKHTASVQAHAAGYVGKIDAPKLAEIQAAYGQKAAELKAQALNEEWPAARLEVELVKAAADARVELIRAERPQAPAIHGSQRDVSAEVIQAAFCVAGNLPNVEKAFRPEILEAAAKYQRTEGASIQGLILGQAIANGYAGSSRRIHRGNYDEVMRTAFIRGAGVSTHSLTTILTTVGNKFLLDGFSSVEQVWREFAAIRPVGDFKAITSFRMLDEMVFAEIGPAGEIEHGTVSQEFYTNQAKTYARMFSLTRQHIINDDLGAFNTLRERIGRGSGIKLNQVFWAKFLDDTAFFTSDRKNLITTALGEPGIAAANLALKSQTDGYGNPIDIGGTHFLLSGPTLTPTARKWYVSQEIRDTTADRKTPTTNIYQNVFRPVESRYVSSTTAWYLLPTTGGDMAPIEVCFLDGVQSPTIESADADFNMLGVQFRGYYDFGVAPKEWRTSVKSTGLT